ncbi:hypothetical protein [Collimonas silvisoli]|uniref:hypothetical protein n=1 Tax=Collimonas silvisoli TaxID=2825884 RepID=UPI001B8C340C|nr:hypothetical protein [Collimonas silvisoli]
MDQYIGIGKIYQWPGKAQGNAFPLPGGHRQPAFQEACTDVNNALQPISLSLTNKLANWKLLVVSWRIQGPVSSSVVLRNFLQSS